MNNPWEIKKLSSVTEINMGQSPLSKDCNNNGEGLPFFQGNADFGYMYPIATKYCIRPKKTAEAGDILISVRAPVGDINIANTKSAIGRGLSSIKAVQIEKGFLFHYLKFYKPNWVNVQQGSTFEAINKADLANLEIPLPSDIEQRKIAAILTSVDKAIEKTEAIIEQTEKVKKGLMQQLLTRGIGHTQFKETEVGEIPEEWEVSTLSRHLIEKRGGASLSPKDFTEEGVKVLPKKGVTSKGVFNIKAENLTFVSTKYASKNCKSIVDSSFMITVLRDLVPSGPNLGRVIEIKDNSTYILAQGVYGFKLDEFLLPKFVVYISNSPSFRDTMLRKKVGSTQVHMRTMDFFDTYIPLPSVEEQREIVKILYSFDEKLLNENFKLVTLNKLKKGLMQDLLTGKVRVQVEDSEVVNS